MQCNSTFCPFVSSILCVFSEVLVNLFGYFWKSNSLFSKICVNCLLMFYFLYCSNCVLNDVNGACCCTCSLVALRVPYMCFCPAKTRKSLKFLRCIHVLDLVLKCGWHKWRKLVTPSLLLHCIGGYSCLRYWNEFLSAVFHVLCWSFLVLQFSPKRLQLIFKSDLTTNGLICGFLSDYGSFRRLHICMDWNLHELLIEPVEASARLWHCACFKCVTGLRRLEKTLKFWDAYMSLTWFSHMVQTKMKETGYSFSFTSLYWWV